MRSIGGTRGVGCVLPTNTIGDNNFKRYIGDRLIIDFREGGGTVVKDRSPCGNDGTLQGATGLPTWERKRLSFDGTDDYISVVDSDSLDIINAITIEILLETIDNSLAYQTILEKRPVVDEYNYYTRLDLGYSRFSFYNGAHRVLLDNTTQLSNDVKYHLATTYDKSNIRLYVASIQVKSGVQTAAMIANAGDLYIGVETYLVPDQKYFKGKMSFIRINAKTFSALEVLQEYLWNKWRN